MSARERGQYRKASLQEIAAALLEPGVGVAPVLSNLAVSPEARRRGVAAALCGACTEAAEEWGFGEIMLEVEAENAAARGLYANQGYAELWRTDFKTAVRVAPDPADDTKIKLGPVECEHVAMMQRL